MISLKNVLTCAVFVVAFSLFSGHSLYGSEPNEASLIADRGGHRGGHHRGGHHGGWHHGGGHHRGGNWGGSYWWGGPSSRYWYNDGYYYPYNGYYYYPYDGYYYHQRPYHRVRGGLRVEVGR